jgi:hypothetical protein
VSVEGIYPQAAEQTALIVNDCEELSIADSEFKTIGARALCIHTSRYPSIENTIFNSCGSHNLIGGAIKITGEYRSHVTIRGCKFHKCIGLIGGGIYARYHYKLSFSDFIDCTSLAFPRSENVENDSLGRGSALFAEETIESEAVLRCRFEECDLNLGTITASCASSICRGSIFKGSHAAYLSRRDSDCRFLENTFEPEKPGVVQITIMTESVLADYVEEYHDVLHDLLQEYLKWNKNRSGLFQQYLKKIESQSENGIQDDEPKLAGLNIFQRQLSAILNEKEKKSQQNCTK